MIERAGLPKAAQPWSRMRQTNDGTSAIFGGNGGRGGIRTHGTLAGTPVFKTDVNH